MYYEKPPLECGSHILKLKERGLIIDDEARIERYLKNVGYFRLTGYMYHLQSTDGNHTFFEGTTFDNIINTYNFDKKLRSIVNEYLERIEIALRARLVDYYSIQYGFYWYSKVELYSDLDTFNVINKEIKDKFDEESDRFIKTFKNKYIYESNLPSNMALEGLSFGKLSRLYVGLGSSSSKQAIALDFSAAISILESWLPYLSNVRNICAHHNRLWNKNMSYNRPRIPEKKSQAFNVENIEDFNTTVYCTISIIQRLLEQISPTSRFIEKIENLFNEYPDIDIKLMGFKKDWKENPAWKRVAK